MAQKSPVSPKLKDKWFAFFCFFFISDDLRITKKHFFYLFKIKFSLFSKEKQEEREENKQFHFHFKHFKGDLKTKLSKDFFFSFIVLFILFKSPSPWMQILFIFSLSAVKVFLQWSVLLNQKTAKLSHNFPSSLKASNPSNEDNRSLPTRVIHPRFRDFLASNIFRINFYLNNMIFNTKIEIFLQ